MSEGMNEGAAMSHDMQGARAPAASAAPLLDRSDVRVKHATGIGGSVSAFVDRVRSGDLGSLPVLVGLVIIWTVFTSLNPVFLSADNLVNLLFDCSTVGVISLGIVCVLMVGQIDLSVGSMSGFASAMVGMLWVNQEWPLLAAITIAVGVGALIGALYALLLNRLGMPSFVATLSGLLAILGLQLYVLGTSGSINLPYGSPMVNFGQMMVIPAGASYLLALVPGAVMLAIGLHTRSRRMAARLSAATVGGLVTRCVVVTLLFEVIVAYLNRGRGVPLMFGVFLALAVAMDYALTRTRWGRSMNAVGGNREAARRAGINVNRVYTSAFVLCASLAALGGVLSAARLASASQQAGTGDVNLNAIAAAVIGGTSLFGGRGSAYSAVLGVIVIQSIASGLTLLNLSSSLRFMITGAVLAIAVIVDSLARQSRVTHGRA
jgi:D-xylose transport system permease protein